MQTANLKKEKYIQIRVEPEKKSILKQAALGLGVNLSKFVLDASLKEAEKIIEEQISITLKQEEFERFFQALENPPEPNAALRKAADDYYENLERAKNAGYSI
ncbi:MAG: DUF1778 domain-containing protein [Calditrichaeota bacterium]|nr:DUF1778 domain-containing protein [Calditrichota bacterium]MCB0267722.1 DUF1778 domain-containing protein [Calditrichota bacterium]MCB0285018.1 DUF1778 domain-containing protein [Calditrichota bacterium]MCB0299531.1 DUF1778 domain-containing protein [Calditrichota bacterium]